MGIVDDPVAYRVGKSRVTYNVMPGIDRELAGDNSGADPVSVLHDLEDVPALSIGKGIYPPVVDNEKPHPLYPFKELPVTAVRPCKLQVLNEPGKSDVKGAYPLPHGAVPQLSRALT